LGAAGSGGPGLARRRRSATAGRSARRDAAGRAASDGHRHRMKRALLWTIAGALLAGLSYVAYRLYDERRFADTPFGEGVRAVQIAQGSGPRAIAQALAQAGVISDPDRFHSHLRYFRRGQVPKAGEYEFDGAVTPDQVLGKLVRGEVKLYRFTVPEGLRIDEIAPIVGATGLCDAAKFLALA